MGFVPVGRRLPHCVYSLLAGPCLLAVTAASARGATTTFGGGTSDRWNVGANWDLRVPISADVAILNSNQGTIRIANGSTVTANAGTLSITAASDRQDYLTAGTLSTNVATLTIGGGAVNGIYLGQTSVPSGDFDLWHRPNAGHNWNCLPQPARRDKHHRGRWDRYDQFFAPTFEHLRHGRR